MKRLTAGAYYWTKDGWMPADSREEAWTQAIAYARATGIVDHYPVYYLSAELGHHILDGTDIATEVERATGVKVKKDNRVDGDALLVAIGSSEKLCWSVYCVEDIFHDDPYHRLASVIDEAAR